MSFMAQAWHLYLKRMRRRRRRRSKIHRTSKDEPVYCTPKPELLGRNTLDSVDWMMAEFIFIVSHFLSNYFFISIHYISLPPPLSI